MTDKYSKRGEEKMLASERLIHIRKRLEEKKFYRDRLSEIKSALYQIKARFNLNEDAIEAVDEVDDLITQEIVL